jgi:hypothetical protein
MCCVLVCSAAGPREKIQDYITSRALDFVLQTNVRVDSGPHSLANGLMDVFFFPLIFTYSPTPDIHLLSTPSYSLTLHPSYSLTPQPLTFTYSPPTHIHLLPTPSYSLTPHPSYLLTPHPSYSLTPHHRWILLTSFSTLRMAPSGRWAPEPASSPTSCTRGLKGRNTSRRCCL